MNYIRPTKNRDDLERYIRELESRHEKAEKRCRWVPVTEALPEAKNDVIAWIVCNDGETFAQVDIFDGELWLSERNFGFVVTHWLPIPPMEEDGE